MLFRSQQTRFRRVPLPISADSVQIDSIDTADVYGNGLSEEYLGKALKGQRDDVVIATKFGAYDVPETLTGGHPEWIKKAVDNSLRRLGADWIDLYQHHFPDAKVPVADTLGALNDLVVAGKVRHIGCSNYGDRRASCRERV